MSFQSFYYYNVFNYLSTKAGFLIFFFLFSIDPGPLVDEYPEVSGITTARDAMKKMPEQDRAKILEQVEVFKVEKRKFDIEVSKWDDNGNDIIVLAKHMVMVFFPFKNTVPSWTKF